MAERNPADPAPRIDLHVGKDPRAAILGRIAVMRMRLRARDKEIVDYLAGGYRDSLGDLIRYERQFEFHSRALERLLELLNIDMLTRDDSEPPAPSTIPPVGGEPL